MRQRHHVHIAFDHKQTIGFSVILLRFIKTALAALKPRFDLYERANKVNDHPWLADLLIWRANRSPRILQRMAGVLEETGNPGNLVSLRGLAKLFLPIH